MAQSRGRNDLRRHKRDPARHHRRTRPRPAQRPEPNMSPATVFQLADLFEATADAVPEREPLVAGDARPTSRELEANANRLAHVLAARGIGPGDHVGIYARNCVEWIEAMLAVFKLRAAVVNVNHRYVDDELAYLFDDAGLRALIFAREFVPRVAAARTKVPSLSTLVAIDDDTNASLDKLDDAITYADALATGSPER